MLALAMVWVLAVQTAPAAPASATADTGNTAVTPRKHQSTLKPTSHRSSASHRYHHRYRRAYDPWHSASSYGEPGLEDNAAGEDPLVRQAALDALGHLNGSVVVVNPHTGRILSIVNQKLAVSSAFTPCSTFKPIVALAALREGLITPNTRLYVSPHLRMNVTDALAHSNNPFFLKLGEMLGFQRITAYAQELGLGEKAGIDIPGESAGRYPSAPPTQGGVGFLAYCGTDVEITPLQMAALISAIANGGTLYALQYPRTPEEIAGFQPVVRRHLDNIAEYIPQIFDGLAGSVLYGTGHSAYDPDLSIFGKTGTCSENGARLGWFMSYAGDPQSKYVAVVLLRGGRMMYGPHAAEVAGRFYRDLLLHDHSTQASRTDSATVAAQ
jgi:cell division protein FtsI/penicillin-binding protein 2